MSQDGSISREGRIRTFSAHKASAEKDLGRSIVSSASICVRSAVMVRHVNWGKGEKVYGFASRLEWFLPHRSSFPDLLLLQLLLLRSAIRLEAGD